MATKETPTRTEVFAIKVPKVEKDAMNLIAAETGKTLSKTFYRAIQHTIFTEFGKVLLDKISRRRSSVVSSAQEEGIPTFLRRSAPMVVVDFIHLLQEQANRTAFHAIFENVQFAQKEWLLYEIGLDELAHHMGQVYLDSEGSLDPLDLGLARTIFFEYMVRACYQHTSMGVLRTLEDEWSKNQAKVEQFRDSLMGQYEERFEEALEVEVVEVLPEEGRRRR